MSFLKPLLSLLFISSLTYLNAQTNDLKEPERSLSEFWIQPTLSGYFGANADLNDFRQLAPESIILNRDYSDWDGYGSNGTSGSGGGGFAATIGFYLKDKEGKINKNRTFRIGLSYGYAETIYNALSREQVTRVDTVVSVSTGEEFFVDSVSNESVGMGYTSHLLNLDASLIFRTDFHARWSVYTGLGARVGMSVNPEVEIFYNVFNDFEGLSTSSENFRPAEQDFESVNLESSFTAGFYIPCGVDFRLGDNPFWTRMHLALELSPNILFVDIPDLDTFTQFGFAQSLGLRVTW